MAGPSKRRHNLRRPLRPDDKREQRLQQTRRKGQHNQSLRHPHNQYSDFPVSGRILRFRGRHERQDAPKT